MADALDSGSNFRKEVEVQVFLPAPKKHAFSVLFLTIYACESNKCTNLYVRVDFQQH